MCILFGAGQKENQCEVYVAKIVCGALPFLAGNTQPILVSLKTYDMYGALGKGTQCGLCNKDNIAISYDEAKTRGLSLKQKRVYFRGEYRPA